MNRYKLHYPTVPMIYSQIIDWGHWNEVCDFIPKDRFISGVYLDDKTKEILPEGKSSLTLGVLVRRSDGSEMLFKQGDFLSWRGGSLVQWHNERGYEPI